MPYCPKHGEDEPLSRQKLFNNIEFIVNRKAFKQIYLS